MFRSYECEHAIVTVPLGVLKKSANLFTPFLDEEKVSNSWRPTVSCSKFINTLVFQEKGGKQALNWYERCLGQRSGSTNQETFVIRHSFQKLFCSWVGKSGEIYWWTTWTRISSEWNCFSSFKNIIIFNFCILSASHWLGQLRDWMGGVRNSAELTRRITELSIFCLPVGIVLLCSAESYCSHEGGQYVQHLSGVVLPLVGPGRGIS